MACDEEYYAHYGHKDFILCLGYKADAIKNYFLNYNECLTNDFVLAEGGKKVTLLNSDIHDWRLTFVDTGVNSNIGQRLKAVERHLDGEEVFLANYVDGLSDLPLPAYIDHFLDRQAIGSFACVRPTQKSALWFRLSGDMVSSIQHITDAGLWINGGYFVFRNSIFQYLREGEELVVEPFQRLIGENRLIGYKYNGFWACMDTFKEKQQLEDLYTRGNAPWEVWKPAPDFQPESVHA